MLKQAVFTIAIAVGVLFASGVSAAGEGPAESVAMLQKGIDTNDMALVEKYLDVNTAIEKGVESITMDEHVLREAANYPAINMALALEPATGNEILRNILCAEAREYLRYGVVSGAFADSPKEGASPYKGLFGKAFKGGKKDKRTFGNATVTKTTGDTAYVKTSLTDGRKKRKYPLDLVVRKQKDVWRITEVSNVAELFGGGKKGK
jgi:hypothetical protein